jgi:hypothetical protein
MLNKNLEHYKSLYSNYIQSSVELYNYNLLFQKQPGRDNGHGVRKHLKYMMRALREMQVVCLKAYREERVLQKQREQDERRAARQAKKNKTKRPYIRRK